MKVLALFCVLLIGSAQCSPTKPNNDLTKFVIKVINHVSERLNALITNGTQIVDYISGDELNELQVKGLELFNKVILAIEDPFFQKIADTPGLDADGVKVWNCFLEDKAKWNLVFVANYDGFTKCSIPVLQDFVKLFNPILNDLTDVDQQLEFYAAYLAECDDDMDCLLGVLYPIIDQIVNIPLLVAEDVQAIVKRLPAFQVDIVQCLITSLDHSLHLFFDRFGDTLRCLHS